jgi:hypothetical protein
MVAFGVRIAGARSSKVDIIGNSHLPKDLSNEAVAEI